MPPPTTTLALTTSHRLSLHAGQAFALFLLLLLGRNWSDFTLTGRLLCGVTFVAMGLGPIEALARRYVIGESSLIVRHWRIARVVSFVPPLEVVKTDSGQLRLRDAQGRRVATIPRGFGTAEARSALLDRGGACRST